MIKKHLKHFLVLVILVTIVLSILTAVKHKSIHNDHNMLNLQLQKYDMSSLKLYDNNSSKDIIELHNINPQPDIILIFNEKSCSVCTNESMTAIKQLKEELGLNPVVLISSTNKESFVNNYARVYSPHFRFYFFHKDSVLSKMEEPLFIIMNETYEIDRFLKVKKEYAFSIKPRIKSLLNVN